MIFLSAEGLAQLLTTFTLLTLERLANDGIVPAGRDQSQPRFARDAETINALLEVIRRDIIS